MDVLTSHGPVLWPTLHGRLALVSGPAAYPGWAGALLVSSERRHLALWRNRGGSHVLSFTGRISPRRCSVLHGRRRLDGLVAGGGLAVCSIPWLAEPARMDGAHGCRMGTVGRLPLQQWACRRIGGPGHVCPWNRGVQAAGAIDDPS